MLFTYTQVDQGMVILVDYNNIPVTLRRKGINYIVDKIVRSLDFSILQEIHRVLIRIYDGWYFLNKLTRTAQELTVKIQTDFPKPFIVIEGPNKHVVTVNVELAYSLAIEPSRHFWHTYRPRGLPPNLVCKHPTSIGCKNSDCPVQVVYDFFSNGSCPNPSCAIKPKDILYKAEQKLVDTMITADLSYYATNNPYICVVTSDDDLWPGIISALMRGARIMHIHTHSKRNTPSFYSQGLGNKYTQKSL